MLALAATGLVLAACESGPKIRANTAPGANLQSYKTYTFARPLGTDRNGVETPLSGYFKEATRREMDARGYQFVEGGDADLMVNFGANASEKTDVRSTPTSSAWATAGYYGYRGGMYGDLDGIGRGDRALQGRHGKHRRGRCAASKQLVWEGLAEGKLTDKVMEDPRAAVNRWSPKSSNSSRVMPAALHLRRVPAAN